MEKVRKLIGFIWMLFRHRFSGQIYAFFKNGEPLKWKEEKWHYPEKMKTEDEHKPPSKNN